MIRLTTAAGAVLASIAVLGSAGPPGHVRAETVQGRQLDLPYAQAGLDQREAAAFLLDRFTYGARPGDLERVVAAGLEHWVAAQLTGSAPDATLDERLARYEALRMTDAQLIARYPTSSQVSAHVRRFYPDLIPPRDVPILDFSVVSAKLDEWRAEHGILTQDVELRDQVFAQKVERAVYAENQLREVLTDFWHNHFFTSPLAFNARAWVLSFERDAVRPNALGSFGTLLRTTAKHPAMVQYYVGLGAPETLELEETTLGTTLAAQGDPAAAEALRERVDNEIAALEHDDDLVLQRQFWPTTGPNLPYARALLELQTLGADGPQTAEDVAEAARAFTGWSMMPIGPSNEWYTTGLDAALEAGFVLDGRFLFRADKHDARPKSVLGIDFAAGGGVEEGERILDHLAAQPATARHIGRKLAVRFVGENPDDALVERLAQAFLASDGDIATVMEVLVESPEFWLAARERTKVKTPLELAASALRATGARIEDTVGVVEQIAAMGQPLYGYMEPTGYPDAGAYWLDPAALLARVRFAQALAANRIAGVEIDTAAVAGDEAPPRSRAKAVERYAARLLPERDLGTAPRELAAAIDRDASDVLRETVALVLASPEFQLR